MGGWFWVVALMTGCVVVKEPENPEPGAGEVEVSWQVGPSGCEVAGVTEVVVEMGGVGGTYDCLAGGATLTVPAGAHDLFLVGLDAQGMERYGGEAPSVVVIGGQSVRVPTVVMSALTATVTASWFFENGRLCSQNGVEQVRMIVYDEDFLVDESVAPCDAGELTIMEIRAGEFDISLLGYDANNQISFSGTAPVVLEKGDDAVVEVQLAEQL